MSWAWWDWALTWFTNHRLWLLWHCWLGRVTHKIVSEMTYNVSSVTLNPTIPYHIFSVNQRIDLLQLQLLLPSDRLILPSDLLILPSGPFRCLKLTKWIMHLSFVVFLQRMTMLWVMRPEWQDLPNSPTVHTRASRILSRKGWLSLTSPYSKCSARAALERYVTPCFVGWGMTVFHTFTEFTDATNAMPLMATVNTGCCLCSPRSKLTLLV